MLQAVKAGDEEEVHHPLRGRRWERCDSMKREGHEVEKATVRGSTPESLCVMETHINIHCTAFTTEVHSSQSEESLKLRDEEKNPPKEEDSEGEEALGGQNQ